MSLISNAPRVPSLVTPPLWHASMMRILFIPIAFYGKNSLRACPLQFFTEPNVSNTFEAHAISSYFARTGKGRRYFEIINKELIIKKIIFGILAEYGSDADFDFISTQFTAQPLSQAKFQATMSLAGFLGKVKDTEKLKKGVDLIVQFREAIPSQYRVQTDGPINGMILGGLISKKEAAGLKEQADYIKSQIPK